MHIDLELALMTAYKYDLEGDAAKALTAYEDVAQTDSYPILYHYPMVKDFIAWRKEVLA